MLTKENIKLTKQVIKEVLACEKALKNQEIENRVKIERQKWRFSIRMVEYNPEENMHFENFTEEFLNLYKEDYMKLHKNINDQIKEFFKDKMDTRLV